MVFHMLLPGLGSRSGLELGVFGSLEPEPEPLEKKPRAGADRKKSQEPEPKREPLRNKPAPQPCWKIKSLRKLYFCYSSLGKIVSFLWLNKQLFYLFYIFFQF